MNLPIARIVFLCLILVWPSLAEAQRQRRQIYPVPVGATHPEFKLPSVDDGQPVSLSDYRGKKVLLVHFASW